jgi:hypothetical protein
MHRAAHAASGSRQLILLALLYAAVAMAVSLAFFPVGDLGVEADFYGELGPAAIRLWSGQFAAANYPYKGPVHSFALLAVRAVAGPFGADWYRSAVLLNALCAAGLLLLVHRWTRELCGERIALFTLLALATLPEFFLAAHKASSDLLFALLLGLALYLLLGERFSRRRVLAGTCVATLAFLTRYNGIVLLPGVVAAWWLVDPGGWSRRRRLEATLLLVAGFALACTPWLLFLRSQTGHLLPPANLQNVLQELYGTTAQPPGAPPGGFTSLAALIAHDPLRWAGHMVRNAFLYLWHDLWQLLGPVGGALALLGLARLVLVRPGRPAIAVLVALLLYRLAMGTIFYLPRFSLPLAPAYCALGMAALLGPWRTAGGWLTEWRHGSLAAGGILGVLLLSQLFQTVTFERMYRAQSPTYLLAAAPRLQRYARSTGARVLMARKPHLAFLSDLEYHPYPQIFNEPRDLLARAQAGGVDLITVSAVERQHFADKPFLDHLDLSPQVTRILELPDVTVFALAPAPASGPSQGPAVVGTVAAPRSAQDVQKVLDVQEVLESSRRLLQEGRSAEGAALLAKHWEEIVAQGDSLSLAAAHAMRGWHAHELGQDEESRRQLHAALALYRALGNADMVRALSHDLQILER